MSIDLAARAIAPTPLTKGLPIVWDSERRIMRAPGQSGRSVYLTKRQAQVFEGLLQCYPRLARRSFLMDFVYELQDDCPGEKIIDVHVCKIRQAMRQAQVQLWIDVIQGEGYRLTREFVPTRNTGKAPEAPYKLIMTASLEGRAKRALEILQRRRGQFVDRALLSALLPPSISHDPALYNVIMFLRNAGHSVVFARKGFVRGYVLEAA